MDLGELSDSIAALVTSHAASVVRVDARRGRGASGVVWNTQGVIVTAAHAVDRDDDATITLADGRTLAAKLVGADPSTDLAVLRVDAHDVAAPDWHDGADLRTGHFVLTLGRPGTATRASLAIVSVLANDFRTPRGGRLERYVQLDTQPRAGYSGSLAIDTKGRAIGVNSAGVLRGTPLMLSVATVRRVVDALLAHGHIQRGYLGVSVYPVSVPPSARAAAGHDLGLNLLAVEEGSPADRAGMTVGDVLVSVAGQPTPHPRALMDALRDDCVGKTVTARILRGGEMRDVAVTVAARP